MVPSVQNLHVGQLAVSQAPSFPFRWTGRGDWALRNRMNMRVSLDRATMGVAELFGGHSFKKILPPADYADEHPEYYALVNGQRKRSTSPGHGDQYCTWNRETGKVVLRNMRTALDANPRARVVSLSPNDGLGFCECPRCLALDEPGPFTLLDAQRGREVPWETARSLLSRRMVLFYNRIADGLAQSHPQVLVKSFAYSLYAAPPADPNLRCSSNLMIQLCHGICHNHSLRDSGCEYNVGYRKFLDGWSASAQHLSIYEYYWKVAWLDLPWPILHTMRADIPTYHAKGVKLLYTQYGANDAGGFGPIYYIAARLLWDVDADVDALLDHFCRKAYGRGADAMLRYYRFWEEQMAESGVHASHSPPVDAILEVFTPENLDAARGLLDEAASVATRSRQRERIERVRLQWEWTTLASRYVRAIEGSLAGYSLRWSGASSTGAQALRRATTPLLSEMRQFLEAHGNDRVIRTQRNNYIARFLRPDFVADAVVETLHQGETGELDSAQWLRAAGARAGERSQGLPAHVCVWVYGSDFDTDGEKSEHDVFLVREDGEPLRIGGLAPPGENANRVNCCIGIPGVPTRHFRPAAATFAITNLPGDWSDSRLFAVYLMPPDLPASSREATFLVERHLDWVRSRSAGFFEFGLEGQRNKDGARALIDVPVIGFPTRPQPVPTIPAVRRYQPAVTLDAAGRGATLDHETAVLSVRADGQLAVGPLVSYRSSQCLLRRLGLA